MISVFKELKASVDAAPEGADSHANKELYLWEKSRSDRVYCGSPEPSESTPGSEGQVPHSYTNSEWEESSDGGTVCAEKLRGTEPAGLRAQQTFPRQVVRLRTDPGERHLCCVNVCAHLT